MYSYHISATEEGSEVTIILDDELITLTTEKFGAARIQRVVSALLGGVTDEELREVLPETLDTFLTNLTERITFDGSNLRIDGDIVTGALSAAILERHTKGFDDVTPLLNFYEKLLQNPSKESQEQLFLFLNNHGLVITESGNFLAYKGVQDNYLSVHSGDGVVNGTVYTNAQLPNDIGNVVEFPRSKVDPDRDTACSTGLHVGSYSYATSFAPRVLSVEVNPRDVVSVPSDYGDAKVRVCRYKVIANQTTAYTSTFYNDDYTVDEPEKPASEFFEELKEFTKNYTNKGKVANSYVDLAEALGYDEDSPEYYFAEELDLRHTANAVYRYHILALE